MGRVELTARWTAAARACESIRPDRLFEDPLAAALAGPEGFALQAQVDGPAGNPTLPIRTRFFDDFLRRVVAEAPVRQVVLVAAGMDTRALRLPWPVGTTLFELDRPELLTAKDIVLAALQAAPRCRRYPVGIDLQDDWEQPLRAAGYRPEQQSVWLLEGLLVYFEAAAVHQLLERVAANAVPGSWLGTDLINRPSLPAPTRSRGCRPSSLRDWRGTSGRMSRRGSWRRTAGRPRLPRRAAKGCGMAAGLIPFRVTSAHCRRASW